MLVHLLKNVAKCENLGLNYSDVPADVSLQMANYLFKYVKRSFITVLV